MTAMRSWLVGSILILVLGPTARAQDVIDQQSLGPCAVGSHQIQEFEPSGQTFIPRGPTLTAVEVFLIKYTAPFSDTLTLTVVEGNVLGPVVASTSSVVTSPPTMDGWYRFTFPTSASITPGLTHSILIDATNPSWGWRDENDGPGCGYPDGNSIILGEVYPLGHRSFRTYTLCGNGTVDAGEQCDDGNGDSTDGCTTSCTICGNGVTTVPEECDDANGVPGDGCENDCTLTSCGDGAVQAPEECDDGNQANDDCCTRSCRLVAAGRGCTSDFEACTDRTCDGAGSCNPSFNSAPCDDGVGCNGADTCSAGVCSIHAGDPCAAMDCGGHCVMSPFPQCVYDLAGTPCTDDGNTCTNDQCDGAGTCAHATLTDGSACHDDACIAGTCASGACQLGSTSACDPCLTCDGSGGCVPPTGLGCRTPAAGGSSVALKNAADPSRDSISWSWKVASGTAKADFGTPLATTNFGLCVFEQSGLTLSARAPAGGICADKACWRDLSAGFSYRDRELTPDGIAKLDLKVGSAGQGKIRLRGKGANLSMPGLGLSTPVTVRLVRSDGPDCWEAVYSTPGRNDAQRFKAKSD